MITKEMPLVELSGSPGERGQAHGESLRELVVEAYARWGDEIGQRHQKDVGQFTKEFLGQTGFLPTIEKYTPWFIEEVKGIADGARVPFDSLLAMQFPDEEILYSRDSRAPGNQNIEAERCSVIAAKNQPGLPVVAGQNMDVAPWVEGLQVLFRIREQKSDLETLVFSFAGLTILNGMNNANVGVCANVLPQLNYSQNGLPTVCVLRGILEQTSYEDAISFIKRIPHASGLNYLISSLGNAGSYECSANDVVEYRPYGDTSRLYHTNHPIANRDQSQYLQFMRTRIGTPEAKPYRSTVMRFQSLETRLMDREDRVDVATVKEVLASKDDPDYPICRELSSSVDDRVIGYTAGSTIYEHSDNPILHIAAGPPCSTTFKEFQFTDILS